MRTRSPRARLCPICQTPMKKSGRTAAGTRRWKCTACRSLATAPRPPSPGRAEQAVLGEFIDWATGSRSQADISGGSGRAFRRRTAWCWDIPVPKPPVTGEVYSQIFIDGMWLAHKWVLLVARSPTHVIAWQWAASESAAAYQALLADLAPPDLATTDGAGGALKAIAATWPGTPIQRCLIHVHRDTVRDLTHHPKTTPGKALLRHSRKLLSISTTEQATRWLVTLNDYGIQYKDWLNQRTTAQQDPQTAARTGRKWWYTHPRARRAWRRLERLAKQGQLFAYLTDPDGKPRPTPAERTTNPIESINSQVRDRLRHHRGATTDHQAAIAEWTLHTYTQAPATPAVILADWHTQGRPQRARTPKPKTNKPTTSHPAGWGTTPTPEEGLWARKGWAGRTS
ncbi:IS1249 family transposase [Actinomyces qiguomingii]|uniref:IS1249 family transposase n=2 Tax=Actinomyces qiguomingii TaxID=2057800 RepID=UPI002467DBF7|nr:IS1249 family transposase [Actinomyces qiguomingii]